MLGYECKFNKKYSILDSLVSQYITQMGKKALQIKKLHFCVIDIFIQYINFAPSA